MLEYNSGKVYLLMCVGSKINMHTCVRTFKMYRQLKTKKER